MSSILSSSGCKLQLSDSFVAVPTSAGIAISKLTCAGGIERDAIQIIDHSPPFNVLWSQNSAHLVVITAEYIYLYACASGGDGDPKWYRERTVEAPRNLLGFQACYSHPLLSIELINVQANLVHASNGEVVVINLLCSLFQTFSIATPLNALDANNSSNNQLLHTANRLSYSGRYLSTAQIIGSNSSSNNSGSNAPSLGVRVYDLLELWVLQSPTQASYLDFKYADLAVDSVPHSTGGSSAANEGQLGSDFSVGTPHTEVMQWGLTQLQWRHTDKHSFSGDSHELFFLAQHTPGNTVPAPASVRHKRNESIGIADYQMNYTDSDTTTSAQPATAAYSDMTVSIYSVSQQPDYENINMLTMAYNAAIVAGQLNQQDDYIMNISQGNYSGIHSGYASNNDSGANLSTLGTPVAHTGMSKSAFTQSTTLTTTLNLLTVVTLSSLYRSVAPAHDIIASTSGSGDSASNVKGHVLFAWVEPTVAVRTSSSIHSRILAGSSGPKRSKDDELGAPLWLALAHDARQSEAVPQSQRQGYSYRVFGVKQQPVLGAAESANAYQLAYVSDDSICTSTGTSGDDRAAPGFDMLQSFRCVGDPTPQVSSHRPGTKGSSAQLPSGAINSVDFHMSFGNTATSSVLVSTVSTQLILSPESATSPSSSSAVAPASLAAGLLDWNASIVNITVPLLDSPAVPIICVGPLSPSANVRFQAMGSSGSMYQVVSTSTAATNSRSVHLVSLADLATGADTAKIITAVVADAKDSSAVRYLYVLYIVAGVYHIGVWSLDTTVERRTIAETNQTQGERDLLCSTAYDSATGTAAASWRAPLPNASTDKQNKSTIAVTTTESTAHVQSEEYTVEVLPDPHFGLGIRIDVLEGRTVVSSFKRHPLSNQPMSAQLTGSIQPGDEFVAINGKVLRGLALAEVIHTIRTTVSEGGDSAVELTMQRVSGSLNTKQPSGANGASPNSSTASLGLRRPEHVRNISSTSSISSAISMNSFGDGLDSLLHRAAGASNTSAAGVNHKSLSAPTAEQAQQSDGAPVRTEVPLCAYYSFVGKVALDFSVQAADLAVHCESEGAVPTVYLVAVYRDEDSASSGVFRTTLSSISASTSAILIEKLSESRLQSKATAAGTRCTVQLWCTPATSSQGRGGLRTTVLFSPPTPLSTTPPWTFDNMPTLLVQDISWSSTKTAYVLQPAIAFDLIPLQGSDCSQRSEPPTQSSEWLLCQDPLADPGLVGTLKQGDLQCAVQLRFQQSQKDYVPLYLSAVTDLVRSGNKLREPLRVTAALLQCLSIALDAKARSATALPNLLDQLLLLNASNPDASKTGAAHGELVSALRKVFTSGSCAAALAQVEALHLGVPAERAVWSTLLLNAMRRDLFPTAEDTPSSRQYLLSGSAMANLLWSNQAQTSLLPLFLPFSDVPREGSRECTLLSHLVPQSCDDVLEHLTSIHAALWLHDPSVLMEIIYKRAVKAFKQHKSSIKIFLEMVLVGKEDTLLQLAKTDREKSGKQLLALLTLEDSFATVKARKSLQKNAFALMKLRRYKDAAAVFLLADPPFIKEACSVLQTQYDDPLFALLVTRLAEHRSAVTKSAASASAAHTTGEASGDVSATAIAAYNGGYLLGPIARSLLRNSVLPSLLACSKRSSLPASQSNATMATATNATSTHAVSETLAKIAGVDALTLGLVSAMWLQDCDALKSAFKELLGRYTLADCSRVAPIASDGGAQDSETIKVLACVDWLVEIGAYLDARSYNTAIQSVHEFMTQAGLHEEVVKVALLQGQAACLKVQAGLTDNAFLQRFAAHYSQYQAHLVLAATAPVAAEPDKYDFLSTPGGDEGASPLQPAMFIGDGDAGTGEEDEQYKEVLRRLAKFQTAPSEVPGAAHVTTPATPAATTSASATSVVSDVVGVPAPAKAGGGFNFAASAKPAPRETSKAAPVAPAVTTGGSMLDAFDVPAPPVRRPQRDAGKRAGATLDMLGDGLDALAPPTRHRRPGVPAPVAEGAPRTPSQSGPDPKPMFAHPANMQGEQSLTVADTLKRTAAEHSEPAMGSKIEGSMAAGPEAPKQGFSFATTKPVKKQDPPNSSNTLDDFDSFAAPVRHRRQPQPEPIPSMSELTSMPVDNSALFVPAERQPVPSALDAFDSFGPPTRPRRQPGPSAAPAITPVQHNEQPVGSEVSKNPVESTNTPAVQAPPVPVPDPFDFLDSFAPPVRARRLPVPVSEPAPAADSAPGAIPRAGSSARAVPASALDAFDAFDSFAAPVRHTRPRPAPSPPQIASNGSNVGNGDSSENNGNTGDGSS